MEIEIEIEEGTTGNSGRLDKFLTTKLSDLSRSRIQSLIKSGHIKLNGELTKAPTSLNPGDRISVTIPPLEAPDALPENLPITVIHEDLDLIVVNKAPGMVVHPAAGNQRGTLVNALLHHCGDLSGIGGVERPGIVHRLDKDTSGCLVAAKNDLTHRALVEAFSGRLVTKVYLAVIEGMPSRGTEGLIENRIGRHPVDRKRMTLVEDPKGKSARTGWQVLAEHKDCALVGCRLFTGRTHQIRVHMKETLGMPILGDSIYAKINRQPTRTGRLMLHAWNLGFDHPKSGEAVSFLAEPPEEFTPWMKDLSALKPEDVAP